MTKTHKVILSRLRKTNPTMLANQIIGVQPMTGVFDNQTTLVGENEDTGVIVYWVKPATEKVFTLNPVYSNSKSQFQEMCSWCDDTFSEVDDKTRWFTKDRKFYFYNELDRIAFLLKWG